MQPGEAAPTAIESRMAGPYFATGPFLVIAQRVTVTRNALASNPKPDDAPNVTLEFALLAEPKVTVVGLSPPVRPTEATDETGSLMAAPHEQPKVAWTTFRTLQAYDTFTAVLGPGRPIGRRIATLKGAIDVKVIASSETVRIDDVASPREGLRVGGFSFKSTAIVLRGQSGSEIILTADRGGADDAAWQAFAQTADVSRFVMYDAAGRALPQYGREPPRNEGQRLIVPLRFRPRGNLPDGTKIGPPAALEWELPTEVREIAVPLEFKDLPLP